MNDLRILFVILVVGILSTAELSVIVMTVPPASADAQVLWVLFIALFLSLSCAFSLAWHSLKKIIHRSKTLSRLISLRQAALVAGMITVGAFLKSLGILSPWDLIPLIASAVLIEFFFEADKRPSYHEPARTA